MPTEKNPEDRIYHIYIKNECVYNCLSKPEFEKTWVGLTSMVDLLDTNYKLSDISYESIGGNDYSSYNEPSGDPSY